MLTLHNVRVRDDEAPSAVTIRDGMIHSITPVDGGRPHDRLPGAHVDCAGGLLLPGFVEPHLHLDKALLDTLAVNEDGTLESAIELTSSLKRSFGRADLFRRGSAVIESAVVHGTTTIRAQTDVDPTVGTLSVEVLLDLAAAYSGVVDLQICAFPQEGLFARPGTLDLLRESLRMGAAVAGGCSYSEADVADCRRHVDAVLDLAEEFSVPADIHADFADDTSDERFALATHIAEQTRARGLGGRVTVGHMTALADLEGDDLKRIGALLAGAGVAVVALPATDLHLGGRGDTSRVRRGIAPVRALRDAGVLTSISSNNVRNAFTPFGNVDQMETGLLLAQTAHMGTPADLREIVSMITIDAARVVGLPRSADLGVGAPADLVVLDAPSATAALLDRAPRRYVIKNGRVVSESRIVTTTRFGDPTSGVGPGMATAGSHTSAHWPAEPPPKRKEGCEISGSAVVSES